MNYFYSHSQIRNFVANKQVQFVFQQMQTSFLRNYVVRHQSQEMQNYRNCNLLKILNKKNVRYMFIEAMLISPSSITVQDKKYLDQRVPINLDFDVNQSHLLE